MVFNERRFIVDNLPWMSVYEWPIENIKPKEVASFATLMDPFDDFSWANRRSSLACCVGFALRSRVCSVCTYVSVSNKMDNHKRCKELPHLRTPGIDIQIYLSIHLSIGCR